MAIHVATICSQTLMAALLLLLTGCAAFHPIQGIDANTLASEYFTPYGARSHLQPIDLALLGQAKPLEHHVDTGDVLGIYIEGILGKEEESPPVFAPGSDRSAPRIGYPVPVREDGTISIPLSPPIYVRNLTLQQVEDEIRRVQTSQGGLIKPGADHLVRIIVGLHKPRSYRVMVVRRDRPQDVNENFDNGQLSNNTRKGSSTLVELSAYENDIAHALVLSGGLPGLDAENAVYVMRSRGRFCQLCAQEQHWEQTPYSPPSAFPSPLPTTLPSPLPTQSTVPPSLPAPVNTLAPSYPSQPSPYNDSGWSTPTTSTPQIRGQSPTSGMIQQQVYEYPTQDQHQHIQLINQQTPFTQSVPEIDDFCPPDDWMAHCPHQDATLNNSTVLKIPLALYPGETPSFQPDDVILHDGDIVYIESRNREFFFTGGLLGGGQYPLPRDYDLDIIGAISLAESRRVLNNNSIGGASTLNQDVTVGASKVIIMRSMPDGLIIPIRVDLDIVKQDPSQTVLIQPGDRIFLQYTKTEACAAFFERHLFQGIVNGTANGLAFGLFSSN